MIDVLTSIFKRNWNKENNEQGTLINDLGTKKNALVVSKGKIYYHSQLVEIE